MRKRIFAAVLALVLLCAGLGGCAARQAEHVDVLATAGYYFVFMLYAFLYT